MDRLQLWSSGGGTQSTAIAALICMSKLKPDISVIVDTEREASEVWEYLDKWVQPALINAGVTLHRVKKSDFTKVDVFYGKDGETPMIPAFTDESGKIGKLRTFCSSKWKVAVRNRFVTTLYPKAKFNVWIGFTTDEMRRVFQEEGRWVPKYPLIERGLSRQDAIKLVERMGWPTPPRSSCWMCPNRSHAEWMHLKEHYPADWVKAVEFEEEIRKRDDALWLTRSGKPLSELPATQTEPDLFTGRCTNGGCFV